MELIGSLFALVFETTIAAVCFVVRLGAAAFSSDYRRQLKSEWQDSTANKIAMAVAALFSTAVLAVAFIMWLPLLFRKPMAPPPEKPEAALKITITSSDPGGTEQPTKTGKVLNAAGELLKRKLEERRQAKEARAPGQAEP